ncbi:apical junction component 1 homolog [Engraulis encrasicolus]|uniref:apical junction component 1 homolog n=1 Tax=Engraulis encrasicolus TaxID=184585 RepID=UPI002FD4FEF6
MTGALEQHPEIDDVINKRHCREIDEVINKRHCRSFDFIDSLDDPKTALCGTFPDPPSSECPFPDPPTALECPFPDPPTTLDCSFPDPPPSEHLPSRAKDGFWNTLAHPTGGKDRDVAREVAKEGFWNTMGRPGHLRFSSPDLFNTKLPVSTETSNTGLSSSSEAPRADGRSGKASSSSSRSKSTPRIRATLTPVPIAVSPPSARRSRDAHQRPPSLDAQRRSERDPSSSSSTYQSRALVNEVHPIKLQPHAPSTLYVTDCFEEPKQQQQASVPHVRCRVDIKPDAAVIQQARRPPPPRDLAWQRYSTSGISSLSVPPLRSGSRTPTPSECYTVDYRHPPSSSSYAAQNPYPLYPPGCMPPPPGPYVHPYAEAPPLRSPSPSPLEPLGREYRTLSAPNIPTKFFYTEDPAACRYPHPHPHPHPQARPYCYDDQYSLASSSSHIPSLNGGHYDLPRDPRDPRARWVHTLPVRPCYGDLRVRRDPAVADGYYSRPYSLSEPGPYYVHPAQPPRGYYRDPYMADSRGVYAADGSKVFYTRPSCHSVAECGAPLGPYYHPRSSQVFSESDWQRSSISGFSSHYGSSQALTPPRMRHHGDPALTPWYPNDFSEPSRLGNYSKSWDNILTPQAAEREPPPMFRDPAAFQRGRSYDNLFSAPRHTAPPPPPDIRQQPIIVNLSSSPRRYAALSVSENSLDRCHADSSFGLGGGVRGSISRGHWYVTPEITITDNDLRAANQRKRNTEQLGTRNSVSWGTSSGSHGNGNIVRSRPPQLPQPISVADVAKDKRSNRFSLQQSLEQLDELLADLVIDYKPPTTPHTPSTPHTHTPSTPHTHTPTPSSRRGSTDLLDQLKQLISDVDLTSTAVDDVIPLLRDTLRECSSAKTSPDTPRDPDSGCYGDGVQFGQDELSANHSSPDELSTNHSPDDDNANSMTCSNARCGRTETLFNACLYFKSCHSCYTFYCSRGCRRDDWDVHKEQCVYGRVSSACRHILKHCRETAAIHKAFSRVAKVGFLSRGRGVLFLGFPNSGAAENFVKVGLDSLLMSPTYLSLRELDGFKDNLGDYCGQLQEAGAEYDPNECFLLNVSIAVGDLVPNKPSPRLQTPTVRKYAKVSLASSSPDKKVFRGRGGAESDMETLILTPPPGMLDVDESGEEGRKAREVCFINIQRELRTRGVFLRHEYPHIYKQLCDFVDSNRRFTPTTIYPVDKRSGKQFMCMIMAASEPRTLDWVATTPHLLDDII